MLVGT